jgi:hypothetical protein
MKGVTHNRLADTVSLMWITQTIWEPHNHCRPSGENSATVDNRGRELTEQLYPVTEDCSLPNNKNYMVL